MPSRPFSQLILSLLPAALALCSSCSGRSGGTELQEEMAAMQTSVSELYSYTWSPERFARIENRERISKLLRRLQANLHTVAEISSAELRDPGFVVALVEQKQSLKRAAEDFHAGRTAESNRKLRALAAGCISCHSRGEVKKDFFGAPPPASEANFEHAFAAAEYLVATRQFNKASKALLNAAASPSKTVEGKSAAEDALRLWLLIEVRVLNRPRRTAQTLKRFTDRVRLSPHTEAMLAAWLSDLSALQEPKQSLASRVDEAADLLMRAQAGAGAYELVKILRATAILHKALRGNPSGSDIQQTLLLLARAYRQFPLEEYAIDWRKYSEELIMRYPGSPAAQRAFAEYREGLEAEYGGAASWPPIMRSRLEELERLALEDPTH